MGSYLEDYLAIAQRLNIAMRALSLAEIKSLKDRLEEKFSSAPGTNSNSWKHWDHPHFESGFTGRGEWWLTSFLTKAEPTYWLIGNDVDGGPYQPGFFLEDGSRIPEILYEMFIGELWFSNDTLDYAISYNDHDVFNMVGTAGIWLHERYSEIYCLLGVEPDKMELEAFEQAKDDLSFELLYNPMIPQHFRVTFQNCQSIKQRLFYRRNMVSIAYSWANIVPKTVPR